MWTFNKHLIGAHRGNRSIRAENTFSAFEKALNFDFIETDITLTKDNIPVIIHDNSLLRTSNIKDYKKNPPFDINYFTLNELKKLDFGSWYKKDDPFSLIKKQLVKCHEIPPQRIPTLEEFLIFIKKYKIKANIELKDSKNHLLPIITAKLIKKYHLENQVLISSFNHNFIKVISDYIPKTKKALLVDKAHPKNLIAYLKKYHAQGYHVNLNILNTQIIHILHKNSFFIGAYTAKNKKEILKLKNMQIDLIFSDFPIDWL